MFEFILIFGWIFGIVLFLSTYLHFNASDKCYKQRKILLNSCKFNPANIELTEDILKTLTDITFDDHTNELRKNYHVFDLYHPRFANIIYNA